MKKKEGKKKMSLSIIKVLQCFEEVINQLEQDKEIVVKDKTKAFVIFWAELEEFVEIKSPQDIQDIFDLQIVKEYVQEVKTDPETAMIFM